MADNDAPRYEFKSVQTVRGMEARTKAKWEEEGWEFVEQDQELLRTKLSFRRVKPKLPLKLVGAGAGLLLILSIVGIVVGVSHGGGGAAAPTASVSNAAAIATTQPSSSPSKAQMTAASVPSAGRQNLTVQNNADLAALLAAPEPSSEQIQVFATKYQGRAIEFDANVADVAQHDNYKMIYDMLVIAGDYSTTHQVGPAFQFSGVSMFDLHLASTGLPLVKTGDNVHLVAQVEDYNATQNLFFLKPVSTTIR
ncbi:DUF4839 domain-containing protein (plasmid) [Arthrobacter sp. YA7-1]|uniref:DUF4839 domain-containing protein n=1 Tax=Arthrobacter sp. YA7-1 TaxID=2987701 RepID=UPI0022267704|nr:DUF4839 domain-containing protein [Arthrobacter sp. YA7-1]UYY83591.1 DUF4839 domain-containing protein [Arthrobacter sp. YA7-1]